MFVRPGLILTIPNLGYDEVRLFIGYGCLDPTIDSNVLLSQNDLDLDMFCREVIRADIHTLVMTPFPNAPTGSQHVDYEINEASTVVDVSLGKHHH